MGAAAVEEAKKAEEEKKKAAQGKGEKLFKDGPAEGDVPADGAAPPPADGAAPPPAAADPK